MLIKNNGQALVTIGKTNIFPDETVEIDDRFQKNSVVKLLIKRGEMIELIEGADKTATSKKTKASSVKNADKADTTSTDDNKNADEVKTQLGLT